MNSFTDFALNEKYKRIQKLGDKLAELESMIDWESFRPIMSDLYNNREIGGRPNTNEILLLKMLVLKSFFV